MNPELLSKLCSLRSRHPCDMLWIRHGETEDNLQKRIQGRSATPLNERGRQQLAELGQRLRPRVQRAARCRVWCSPMLRTVESAEILAAALQLDSPRVFEAIQEIDLGRLVGRRLPELHDDPDWQHYLAHPFATRFPGGESFDELALRVVDACQSILDSDDSELVLVLSHGGVICCLSACLMGVCEEAYHRLWVANARALGFRLRPPDAVRLLGLNLDE